MRIALVSHGDELNDRGGPTSRIAGLTQVFKQLGHHVESIHNLTQSNLGQKFDVVHLFNSWPLDSAIQQLQISNQIGTRVIFSPIALNLMNQPFAEQAAPALLQQASTTVDLIQGFSALEELVTARWWKDGDLLPPCEGVPGHHEGLRKAIGLADHIIFLSEYERTFLRSIGASIPSSTLVWNASRQLPYDASLAEDFKSHFKLDQFILNIGRIEKRKNQAALAVAAKSVGFPLVCLGSANDKEYLQLVREWGPEGFLHIPHSTNVELISGALSAATAFCMPSWSEGAPIAALEARFSNAPLILSNMSAEQEYFGDRAQYTHPCDIAGIADAIARCDDQRNKRSANSELDRFSDQTAFATHADLTLRVYEKTLSNEKPFEDEDAANLDLDKSIGSSSIRLIAVETILTRKNRRYSAFKFLRSVENGAFFPTLYFLCKRYLFRIREFFRSNSTHQTNINQSARASGQDREAKLTKTSVAKRGVVFEVHCQRNDHWL